MAGQGFVNTIIHNLIDQVMKAFGRDISDIHRGAYADGAEAFQYGYLLSGVFVLREIGQRVGTLHKIISSILCKAMRFHPWSAKKAGVP
jgi:hypothetical protein